MKLEIEMSKIECAKCGIPFAIPKDREERLRKCHNTFYCPDGHPQSFTGKTDEERLQEELNKLRTEMEAKNAEISRLSKPKRKVSKK